MDAKELAVLAKIKKELWYDDDEYSYNYDLVKKELEDFAYNYNEYDPDQIDTNDYILADFDESEIASNFSEAPTVSTYRGRLYGCKRCNLEFLDVQDTFKHRAKFHPRRKPFMCLICNVQVRAKKKYLRHMQKHSVNTYLYCSICRIMFEKRKDLSTHLLSHMKNTTYCGKCKKYFKSKNLYRHHLNAVRDTYSCRICCNKFFYLKCYVQHMITHLRYDKLAQNLQQRYYSTKRCLEITRNDSEVIKINFVSTPVKYRFHRSINRRAESQKFYKCFRCLSTFVSKTNLNKSKKLSSGRHTFKCPLCRLGICKPKKLPSPSGNHTRHKLYSCGVCNLKFYDKAQKQKHVQDLRLKKLTHDRKLVHQPGIQKLYYNCDICSWKFPDAAGLKAHVYFTHF